MSPLLEEGRRLEGLAAEWKKARTARTAALEELLHLLQQPRRSADDSRPSSQSSVEAHCQPGAEELTSSTVSSPAARSAEERPEEVEDEAEEDGGSSEGGDTTSIDSAFDEVMADLDFKPYNFSLDVLQAGSGLGVVRNEKGFPCGSVLTNTYLSDIEADLNELGIDLGLDPITEGSDEDRSVSAMRATSHMGSRSVSACSSRTRLESSHRECAPGATSLGGA